MLQAQFHHSATKRKGTLIQQNTAYMLFSQEHNLYQKMQPRTALAFHLVYTKFLLYFLKMILNSSLS